MGGLRLDRNGQKWHQTNYSGDPKTGPFKNRTFVSLDHFICTEKKLFIKWSWLVVFGCHFVFLPFKIRTLKTPGFWIPTVLFQFRTKIQAEPNFIHVTLSSGHQPF